MVALALLALAADRSWAVTPIQPADLSDLTAKAPVRDSVLKAKPRARAAADRTELFVDQHGHQIALSTYIDGLDLAPYASVLAGTLHYDEIEDLAVWVVPPADVQEICGAADALACYGPDGRHSLHGTLVIPTSDPDLQHIIVHEYGHHVDNQLDNLAHVFPRGACGFDNDGSRNWFFERDVEDNILSRGISCDPSARWEDLLGELFAEDYAWLVGNRSWVLPGTRNPTSLQLDALAYDFAYPLQTRTLRATHRASTRLIKVFKRFETHDWYFVEVTLRGPRRADLDLFLYRPRARKPFAKSMGRASRERIRMVLPPGRYEVGVHAYQRAAVGRVRVVLE